MKSSKRVAIVGGGAAGFFCAINLKEMSPEMEVTIFERSTKVLAKVAVSGGGRCNCTNSFASVRDLQAVYPRGHRLMKRLFNVFSYRDAYAWFEAHGVPLTTQDDECVFPAAQDSQAIIGCFLREAQRHGVTVRTGCGIDSLSQLHDFDCIVLTTGGMTRPVLGLQQEELVEPVPSLFTFRIDDEALHELMGTVVNEAQVMLPGTKMRASGPLLITHWGMSGPAVLRLSSYGARLLADHHYEMPLSVNWTGLSEAEAMAELGGLTVKASQKQLPNMRPIDLPARLWTYLAQKALGNRSHAPWGSLNRKELNRLVNVLTNDQYQVAGRAPFKDEFVTCGGVSLSAVNASTLESRSRQGLYFAGEVLDIDGVTGGFNCQAAWTTAYVVAKAIANQ